MRTPSGLPFSSVIVGLCLALGLAACGDSLSLPPDGQPAAIVVKKGDGQMGRVREPLNQPLVVQVTDGRGRPVEGVAVAFELTSAGSEVVPHEKTTDADGLADARLVLGTTVGRQTGKARVVSPAGSPPVQADFSAMALPEDANSMAPVAGQDQAGYVSQPLVDRLVVEVTDGFGNPVAGVPISWSAEGGGTVSEAIVPTGEDGRSRVERILGPAVGRQSTIASSEGLAGSPVTFIHTALAGNASRLLVVSGNGQTGTIGAALPADLVVRLVDADGNGVPATAVSWVVATGGGSANPENSTTDGEGYTSARWTLGDVLGEQRLDAVVSGVGVVSFRATAGAGAPASLFIRTQPSTSARNGVRLDRQPVIQLRDSRGNDVAAAGVQVTVSLGGGGELQGTTRRSTDAAGRATFDDLSISGAPGSRTLVFTAPGYAQVTSNPIELEAIGTTTRITSDSPDPSVAGSVVTVNFEVTSSAGTPTGSVTVTVTGDNPPPPCTVTLSSGTGSCQFTLNVVGDRTFTATYSGGAGFAGSQDTESHVVAPAIPANEAPEADFNWHCEDLTCHFTDASRDDDGNATIASRHWDFGDGTSIDNQLTPSHTYASPGDYRVTLTVTDNGGLTDDASDTVDPTAPPPPNQPPTAEFTWQCDELDCEFEDGSNDPDGDIDERVWEFGDGETANNRNPDHEYDQGGTYTVKLTVTDNDRASAVVEHTVTVTGPNERPNAEFASSCVNLDCQFTDQSTDSDGTIVSWSWDFDDETVSSEQSPPHSFGAEGTYRVRLTVTDDRGGSETVEHDVSVTAPNSPPTAEFSSLCDATLSCTFDASASADDGSIVAYSWDFGDTRTGSGNPGLHTYGLSGTYQVTLTVTDDEGATGSKTQSVPVP